MVLAHPGARTSTSWTLPASAGPSSRMMRGGRISLRGLRMGGTSFSNARTVADLKYGRCFPTAPNSIASPRAAEIRCPIGAGNSRSLIGKRLGNELRKENIVKTPHHRHLASLIAVATLTFAAGCHKKAVPPPPPPPPSPTSPAPTATITVTPSTIDPGGSAVLAWRTTDATDVSIDGLGTVNAYGTQNVLRQPNRRPTIWSPGAPAVPQMRLQP